MRKILLGSLLATTMLIPAFAAGDMWRSSKLIGLNVYNDQNERLGDISEILLDKSGKVDGVALRTSSSSTSPSGTTGSSTAPANRPATAPTPSTTTTTNKWYPDHPVLSGATKDSLKGMPEFKYD